MLDPVALTIFIALFVLVTVIGFVASRWRQGDLSQLSEWGLGGRSFGTFITWFLLGGDLYTAYTFIAVPAAVYAIGAPGFFAVPYTIIVYPIVFMIFPRLWSVAKQHGYITTADFVRARFESRNLSLAVAFTGILATMPYIALQLVGIQAVIGALGLSGSDGFAKDLPLLIAFVILALYTYNSGLRAPALIALVKDVLIYIAVIAVIIVVPANLGGFGAMFAKIPAAKLTLTPAAINGYWTLALGSALALFLYPHSVTGVLSAKSGNVVKRNAALLPAYSFVLGLLALIGFMAIASGIKIDTIKNGIVTASGSNINGFIVHTRNDIVPALILQQFPNWFVGIAFAAIAIGALVPAAVMSIAAANTFTRNIYKELFRPNATATEESNVAKITSLVVKAGALLFIFLIPTQSAIDFQLLGGIWILQTLPPVIIGLYTRWFHRWGMLAGWFVGMAWGTWMVHTSTDAAIASGGANALVSSITLTAKDGWGFLLADGKTPLVLYIGVIAVAANLIVAAVLSLILNGARVSNGRDATSATDYLDTGETPAMSLPGGKVQLAE